MIQPGSLSSSGSSSPQKGGVFLGSPLLLLPPTVPAGLRELTHLSYLKWRFKLGPLICKRLTACRHPAALDIHVGNLGFAWLAAAVGLRGSWGSVASWQKPLDTWPPSLRPGNSRFPGSRVVWPTFIFAAGTYRSWEGMGGVCLSGWKEAGSVQGMRGGESRSP